MNASTRSQARNPIAVSEGQAKESFVDWTKYDGERVVSSTGGAIYLVMNGQLRWIPDVATYNDLFTTWNGINQDDYLVDNVPMGTPLSSGALLARGAASAPQYLVTNGQKCWIPSPAVLTQFNFKQATAYPQIMVDYIPTGANVG